VTKRTTYLAAAAIIGVAAMSSPSAEAAYVFTFEQVGANVIETGAGSLDLTDLDTGTTNLSFDAEVYPKFGRVYSGVFTATTGASETLPESLITFGPGSFTKPSMTSGDPVGFESGAADLTTLLFPVGYISGAPLSDSSTYLGATISSLGLTPGAYVVGWGSGDHADTLTINVVSSPPLLVPEPSTWAMIIIGFAAIGYAAFARRESAAA
jgi:PEP-CTERM motif